MKNMQNITDIEFSVDFDFNTDDFDIDLFQNEETRDRYMKPKAFAPVPETNIRYENAAKLAKKYKFNKNERMNCIVGGKFVFGDFLEALIIENGIHCKEVIVQSLSINQNNVDSLHNLLIANATEKLTLIISHYEYAHIRHDLFPYLIRKLDIDDKFQFAVYRNHSKIILIETDEGHKIVIHGSANLRSCAAIEQFVVEDNPQFYDFLYKDVKELIEKYKIINHNIDKNVK